MGMKNVNLKAIAAGCNASVMTVSRALRDNYGVSESLKKKIRQVAVEMGYMPNQVTQTIKKEEHPTIAILIDDFNNLYYSAFVNELMNLMSKREEYDCTLLYNRQFDKGAVKQCILQRVDVVVTHIEPDDNVYELLKLNNIQVIMVGSSNLKYDIDIVSVDNQKGSVLAARYLHNFHSCDKYIYVGVDYFLSHQRREWFADELRRIYAGACDLEYFDVNAQPIEILYNYIVEGYRSIFVYNDMVTYRVLEGLDKIAYDIRRVFPDLHLVGFDGLCAYISALKQITTIKIDYKEFAKATYEVISNRIKHNETLPRRIMIPESLHRRKI